MTIQASFNFISPKTGDTLYYRRRVTAKGVKSFTRNNQPCSANEYSKALTHYQSIN